MIREATWQEQAKELSVTGMSWRSIASKLAIPRSTVSDFLRKVTKTCAAPDHRPKTLLIDLESAPSRAWVWGRWKQNVGVNQVISDGYLLTYSAKWLGSDLVLHNRIWERENDKELVAEVAELFSQADIVVAHNAKKFDVPLTYSRMLYHGMLPQNPVKVEDTLEMAKKTFKLPSNSLDGIASYLGLSRKMQNDGFPLWVSCMNMEEEGFDTMMEYNDQDVVVLEQVYRKLSPWWSKHQNASVYYNDGLKRCPLCGSTHLDLLDKKAYTQQSEFDAYRCADCGKVSRAKQNNRSKESMKNTLVNVL